MKKVNKSKVQASADRIVKAVMELNDACRDAWDEHDYESLKRAYRDLERKLGRSDTEGEPIEGWMGNQLNHSDAINAGMQLMECYAEPSELKAN